MALFNRKVKESEDNRLAAIILSEYISRGHDVYADGHPGVLNSELDQSVDIANSGRDERYVSPGDELTDDLIDYYPVDIEIKDYPEKENGENILQYAFRLVTGIDIR